MPIYSPTGFLDITNATLRTSNLEAQNFRLNGGNIYVTSELTTDELLNLDNVVNAGNTTSNTVQFTNTTTGLVVDSNIVVAGNVTAGSFLGDGSGLTSIPPSAITGTLSQWSDGTNSDVYIASNVGIGNVHTLTSNTLQVGANLYVRDADANVLTVTGNVAADYFEGDGSKLTGISSTLQAITDSGNVTSNTVQFSNATTGFVTTSNIEVGGALKINTITAAAYHALSAVTAVGASTGDTIQLTNATTGLVTTANVDVGRDLNVTGNLNVLGTRTIVDTDTLRVKDPIIELGKDNPGTGDLGLVMTRPSGSSNVAMIFDESTDTLEIGYTQSNASDTDITMRTAATEPLDVNVNGNVSVGKELTVSGNVSDLNVVSNVNMLHTSNTAALKLNSNVVTEFPRSKKFMRFPRVALTSAAGESSGYQGFYVTESSNSANTARHSWKAFNMTFDNTTGDNAWANDQTTSTYSGSDYAYNGSINLGTGAVDGEWIKLQLPHKIKLEYMKIWLKDNDPTRIPEDWKLYGSDDNLNWTELFSKTGQGAINENLYNVNAQYMYNYLAVVVTKISGQSDYFRIVELEYFGTPEYDPDANGVDVKVTSYPNVPNTDWLEVYYDAKNYTSGVVQDLSTNSFNGTLTNGASFNNSDGIDKFVFDGTNDYISGSIPSTFTGNQTYTFSIWVKPNSHPSSGFVGVFEVGTRSNDDAMGLYFDTGKIIHLAYADNLATTTVATIGQWVHITGTYTSGDRRVYANGNLLKQDDYSDLTLAGTTFKLGSNLAGTQAFDGSIANFRLFNRVLTQDEIYQLYAYQKEYFGHGDLSMTLKAGRLGIGTSEPRAALDVRGDIIGGCPAFFDAYRNSGNVNGNTNPIIFNVAYINKSGVYDNTTGKFTAPIAGYYKFFFHGCIDNPGIGGDTVIRWVKNGTDLTQKLYGWVNANSHQNISGSVTVYLSSSDTFWVRCSGGTISADNDNNAQSYTNGFSGFYLSN